jgi:hypothetical protein
MKPRPILRALFKDWNHSDENGVPKDKMVEKRRHHVERNQCKKRPDKENMNMISRHRADGTADGKA